MENERSVGGHGRFRDASPRWRPDQRTTCHRLNEPGTRRWYRTARYPVQVGSVGRSARVEAILRHREKRRSFAGVQTGGLGRKDHQLNSCWQGRDGADLIVVEPERRPKKVACSNDRRKIEAYSNRGIVSRTARGSVSWGRPYSLVTRVWPSSCSTRRVGGNTQRRVLEVSTNVEPPPTPR